ncbi:hypothetical protein CRE_05055 [Caenorhabditis remanei]|uniref:Seven TM Receptor n=1 Tax=Caenorhabditis remanei TaxID=31234 RepID=E3MYZ4_CAERE|nr:hypothetical protein CRE_05055 [Caenorhabditis remanei]
MTSAFLTITEYCILVGKFGFFSNAIFGGILVYLTVFCIKRQFGSYKKLLVNFQVVGFIFASFDYVFPTLLHTYNRTLVYFSFFHPFQLPNYILQWMSAAYCGIFAATLCILAIQFLYRFWSVFDTPKLIYFDGFNYFIWIVYYIFFGALWAFAVGYFFALDDYGKQYLADEFVVKYHKNISDIPILSLLSYEENSIKWESLYGLSMITGISTVQYTVICVCAFKMYKGMREKLLAMSPLHRRIHNQFYKALLIQTFAPSIFLFSPVFFMLSIPYADLNISFPSSIFASGFTVYPAIDSICIMYCVSEYGRCFRNLVSSVKVKLGYEHSSSITQERCGNMANLTATN